MSTHGFDSFPPEIAAAIFQHCLPDTSDHVWPSSLEAPLLLAQICHRWREICLDTPCLWTSIAFGDTRSIELLKEWLLRARHHLLTIYLGCRNETRARMLIDVVKPYCLRWRDICFVLPLSGHYQLKTSTFPCLERLTLSVASGYPSDARKDPVIIRDAPLLRQVTLFFILSLQVNLPMEQLTILDFTYMYIPQVIALLRRCPNLADLTCRLVRRGDYDDEPPPVELHALRRLNIPNETLLVYLTAPHLERLQIRRMSDSVQVATSALHELISRSSCALKFLAIPFGGIPAAQIKYLFGSTNTIEHLQLSFEYSLEAPRMLLQALCSVDVLPRLRRLEIHDDDPMKGERARSLLDLLAWRRTHAALESFELVVSTGKLDDVPPATIMAEFRALGEAGLHVRVTIPQPDYSTPSVVLLDTLQPGS